MQVEIEYQWKVRANTPKEINRVVVESNFIPRVGERVDITVKTSKTEWAQKYGVVNQVTYKVRSRDTTIIVSLE